MCMRRRIVLQDQGLGRVPRLPQHLQSCTVPVVLQPIFLGVRDPSRSGMLRSQSGIFGHLTNQLTCAAALQNGTVKPDGCICLVDYYFLCYFRNRW